MDHSDFARYIQLLEPCIYFEEPGENIDTVLAFAGCPKEWREPIRVMALGWSYYSADVWYAKYVDIGAKRDWMDKYWDNV